MMDKQLSIRRPVPQKHHGLSTVSKIFFGVDIFQVVVVVVFQSIMIGAGNFNPYNSTQDPGMGPGRRIYMCVYMGVIVYTCFLCLFAVKQQNFLEILAFLLQNFGFVAYGLIQVYHVGYKPLPKRGSNITMQHSQLLRNVALTNSLTLFVLNGVFMLLSWKLYIEFGWKIYKRVRFNLTLRSIYHFYQLLSCLLKMAILYWWMYAICNSFVLLRDYQSVIYYINLAFIPTSILYAWLGYFATQREIKILMSIFILWTLGLIGYFLYKLYGFLTDTCSGCKEFKQTGNDIPDEAMLHFIYLGTLNLLLLLAIFGVSCKVFSNFGKGLAQHFKPNSSTRRPRLGTDLYLRRISHFFEESVVSVTSYESEHDELQESMRLGYQAVMLASGAPLLNSNNKALASSMPNLFEPEKKSQTFPGAREKVQGSSLNADTIRCELDVIDEHDDKASSDNTSTGVQNSSKRTTKKKSSVITNSKKDSQINAQSDCKTPNKNVNGIPRKGIDERSASCPTKDLALRDNSKELKNGVNGDLGDDDVFVDRSDCDRDSRDSGFLENLPKCHTDGQKKLKIRKVPIISSQAKTVSSNNGCYDDKDKNERNGIKAQINLFNKKSSHT